MAHFYFTVVTLAQCSQLYRQFYVFKSTLFLLETHVSFVLQVHSAHYSTLRTKYHITINVLLL